MAAMMLTRLMRMPVRVTVPKAIRKPMAKPLTRLIGVNWNARLRVTTSEKLLKMGGDHHHGAADAEAGEDAEQAATRA